MEIGIQRTDSQRSQNNNNGPRVSFNKDVHVKRIGSRQPEILNYPIQKNYNQSSPLRVELPYDLSKERYVKEAEFVLAQANTVEKNRGKIPNIKNEKPDKFNSLPTRKKKTKPVERSVSDASNKKLKRPTLFNIFSRKSDSNIEQINTKKLSSSGKKIGRSKSDVGTTKVSKEKRFVRKRNNSENEDQITLKKKTQLSPIIEVIQRDDYFTGSNDIINGINNDDKKDIKKEIETNQENNIDLIISKPIAEGIKETINTISTHSKSPEDMHSSQQPTLKPMLTKGLTVDGMVKRLSMERFSPPPHISGPAFSYTRPNEQIIYAQEPQSIRRSSSPTINRNGISQDTVDFVAKTNFPKDYNKSHVIIDSMDSKDTINSKKMINTQKTTTITNNNNKYSQRQNSDEDDEGLGIEFKKGADENCRVTKYSNNTTIEDEFKSMTDDVPITPKIRDVPPEKHYIGNFDISHRGRADGMDTFYPEFQDLSHRRKVLESRIKSRKIGGSREIIDNISQEREFYKNPINISENHKVRANENMTQIKRETINNFERVSPEQDNYLSQNKDFNDEKYHRFGSRELHTRYSPQRNHLDMISLAPRSGVVTSKTHHETKYYNNGRDGFKETFISETKIGKDGKPYVTERRVKERLNSPKDKEIDLGYIEDHGDFKYEHVEPDTNYFQQKYRLENEPKSLDSQFSDLNRTSPEHKIITATHINNNHKYEIEENINSNHETVDQYLPREDYPNSLKRQKKHQRSFDKGDSGIENDFRKDSFNGEFSSRWRKRTIVTDIKVCEIFLKNEQKHTEETFVVPKKFHYIYRERSIDDGSHFDPRLDKYSSETLLRRTTEQVKNANKIETNVKQEKKISGLEKVKQLFSGTNKKKVNKKIDEKDKVMVREEEMRARYKEYRGQNSEQHHELKTLDISTRRRLSTPKASPIPKRNLTPKSTSGQQESVSQKSGWFKSIDRLSRKKPIAKFESTTESVPNLRSHVSTSKSLRFFGDTDVESTKKSSGKQKQIRQENLSSTLPNTQKKLSKSAYDLNKISQDTNHVNVDRHKSASLQHLENNHQVHDYRYNDTQDSRIRNLQDISESLSASENDQSDIKQSFGQKHRHISKSDKNISSHNNNNNNNNNNKYNSSLEDDMESELLFQQKHYMLEDKNRRIMENKNASFRNESPNLTVNESRSNSYKNDYKKPPPGPPKPARSLERRREVSGDRIQDSSGTEESSQQSQRSVVYLHATTIGEIPQPYVLNARRKTVSRDDLSTRPKKLQPMTRKVSRSVSVLSPWKPKHLHDGYEINYSQTNEKMKKNQSVRIDPNRKTSTLTKPKKDTSTLTRSRKSYSKDELSSEKSSSLKSSQVSKQDYPTLLRTNQKREITSRNDTITRKNNKENNLNSSESSRRKWNH